MGSYGGPDGPLDARDMRIAIVAARFNDRVTTLLVEGAIQALASLGLEPDEVPVHWVPGAFEIPLVAHRLAGSGEWDAVVCLGAVIRGDTPHFEYVAGACADGVLRASLDTGVPCVFGVLTTEDVEQALDRAGVGSDKGAESASTAVEMVMLLRELP
jgi:6,7-dimethyl-8-ribityllumazine synthase